MNRKGFTLVELLAVIAILAILVIIALPNVLEMYNNARKSTFFNEVQSIYDGSKKQYLLGQLSDSNGATTYTNTVSNKELDLNGGTGGDNFKYCVTLDANGNVTSIKVTNGTYKYETSTTMDNADASLIDEIGDNYTFSCNGSSGGTTRYLYSVNLNPINKGATLTVDNTYVFEDASSAVAAFHHGYAKVFLTHLVDSNNVVLDSSVSYIVGGNTYNLKGGDGGASFEDNKNILIGLFGSSECYTNSYNFHCGDEISEDGGYGEIKSTGHVRFGKDRAFCSVNEDGSFECNEVPLLGLDD